MKKITTFLLRHEYLIWILCACAILRLPSLLEPYWYGDEGIYLTLGTAIRRGLTLYRDIHDNKPPVIYFIAALTGTVFWFRFFLLLWNSIAIVAYERLAHLLLDKKENAGVISIMGVEFPRIQYSTIATALFAILPFFAEGAIANGEIFMIMPVIVGMYLLWRQMTNDKPTWPIGRWQMAKIALAGFFFSLAFLIKVPSLFDAFAAGFFFFIVIPVATFFSDRKKFEWQAWIKPAGVFILAFLLPILLSFGYYSAKGVGKQYVAAAFAQNIGYLSSWATGTHKASNVGSSGLKNRAIGFGIALVILLALTQKNGRKLTFLGIWFAAALFGSLLAERPYPHYLIQVIPAGALLLISLFKTMKERNETASKLLSARFQITTGIVTMIIFVASIYSIHFWYYPLLPYYQNYISFVTKRESKEQYFAHFDPRLPDMYKTSAHLTSLTSEDDRIFVWGDDPMIYALSRRLPPGRYTSSYHIIDFNGFDETTAALEKTLPKYIVLDSDYTPPYMGLREYMAGQYVSSTTYGPFVIYRRVSP